MEGDGPFEEYRIKYRFVRVALQSRRSPGDREKALEAGCDDYDAKPIELPRLLGKMETLLNENGVATP
jgi:CheY-like chemotaxis protein